MTLISEAPKAPAEMWWGFLRGDGTPILKPYSGPRAMAEAEAIGGTKYVRGPFLAATRVEAMEKLRRKIQLAQARAADRVAASHSIDLDLSESEG